MKDEHDKKYSKIKAIICFFIKHDYEATAFALGISDLHGEVIEDYYECQRCWKPLIKVNPNYVKCNCEECQD